MSPLVSTGVGQAADILTHVVNGLADVEDHEGLEYWTPPSCGEQQYDTLSAGKLFCTAKENCYDSQVDSARESMPGFVIFKDDHHDDTRTP